MNFRLSTLLWIGILAAAAYGLYAMKWEVRELKRQNALLQADIVEARQSIRLLEAEWAYLNRPERLRLLAAAHLPIREVEGRQLADLEALKLLSDQEMQTADAAMPGETKQQGGVHLSAFRRP